MMESGNPEHPVERGCINFLFNDGPSAARQGSDFISQMFSTELPLFHQDFQSIATYMASVTLCTDLRVLF